MHPHNNYQISNTHLISSSARGLKFWIYIEEGLYYPCSENKGAIQLRGITAKLICVFVFAYAKIRFSRNKAHMVNH